MQKGFAHEVKIKKFDFANKFIGECIKFFMR